MGLLVRVAARAGSANSYDSISELPKRCSCFLTPDFSASWLLAPDC